MKKTFRFLSIALLACCMTLVGCNPTPEDENDDTNNNQNPSVSYSFEGVADWPITSSYVGYEYAEGDTLIYVLGSKDAKELNELINAMDGEEFERFCARLLMNSGYEDVSLTKGSGDQGIDIIAYRDGIKYGIQCKCYSSDIGNAAVQEVFAGKTFYKCNVGIVLTNQHFSPSAIQLAEANGIVLWGREFLLKLIKKSQ